MPLILPIYRRKVTSEERYRRILSDKTEADKALDRVINRMIYGQPNFCMAERTRRDDDGK